MIFHELLRAEVHIFATSQPALAQAQVVLAHLFHDPLQSAVFFVVFEAARMGPVASSLNLLETASFEGDVARHPSVPEDIECLRQPREAEVLAGGFEADQHVRLAEAPEWLLIGGL